MSGSVTDPQNKGPGGPNPSIKKQPRSPSTRGAAKS